MSYNFTQLVILFSVSSLVGWWPLVPVSSRWSPQGHLISSEVQFFLVERPFLKRKKFLINYRSDPLPSICGFQTTQKSLNFKSEFRSQANTIEIWVEPWNDKKPQYSTFLSFFKDWATSLRPIKHLTQVSCLVSPSSFPKPSPVFYHQLLPLAQTKIQKLFHSYEIFETLPRQHFKKADIFRCHQKFDCHQKYRCLSNDDFNYFPLDLCNDWKNDSKPRV